MPVHSAGPRIYKSVKFKHLVKKHGSGAGGRASNISLNITPFVDMMTILVCFLLMVFSQSLVVRKASDNRDTYSGTMGHDAKPVVGSDTFSSHAETCRQPRRLA